MRNHGLALLAQQLDEVGLLGDQGVDTGGCAVEVGDDGVLFRPRWNEYGEQAKFICLKIPLAHTDPL